MITGLLLAAGGARRFGSQKLVALLEGVPLVTHAANALLRATDGLVVVTGHDAAVVRAALSGITAVIIENADWSNGLANSIRCGISAISEKCDAVVIALGDQPGIDGGVIEQLIRCWRESDRPIVATRYQGQRGHPVLFDRSLFAELAQLHGDIGARELIARSPDRVAYVDVDTPPPPDVDLPSDLDGLRS